MKIIAPQPFTFEGGKRAVLLLHGFTTHTGDVRMLGRFLQKKGYTCHAPLYSGHGKSPEDLIKTSPEQWWQDVLDGYSLLKNAGHNEIAVAGLSLGGLFSLKLAYTKDVKGIVPMCTPMHIHQDNRLRTGVFQFARNYLKYEGKTDEQIDQFLNSFNPEQMLKSLQQINEQVRNSLSLIKTPTLVVQGRLDKMIDINSAEIIYNGVEAETKKLNWYEQSGHAITLDEERHILQEDIYQFLEQLKWND